MLTMRLHAVYNKVIHIQFILKNTMHPGLLINEWKEDKNGILRKTEWRVGYHSLTQSRKPRL